MTLNFSQIKIRVYSIHVKMVGHVKSVMVPDLISVVAHIRTQVF